MPNVPSVMSGMTPRDLIEGRVAGAQGGFNLNKNGVAPKTEEQQIEELEAAFGAGIDDAPIEAAPEINNDLVEQVEEQPVAPVVVAQPKPAKPSALHEKLAKVLGEEEAGELVSMLESAKSGSTKAQDELLMARFGRAYPELKNPKVFAAVKAMGGDFRAAVTTLYGDRKGVVQQHLASQMTSPRKGAERAQMSKDDADEAAAAEFLASGDVNKALALKAQLMGPQSATKSRFARRGNMW